MNTSARGSSNRSSSPTSSSSTRRSKRSRDQKFTFENLEDRNMLAADLGLTTPSFSNFDGASLIYQLDQSVPADQQQEILRIHTGMNEDESFQLIRSETDQIGFTHYRYQQMRNGFPVEHGTYSVHVQDDQIVSLSGDYVQFEDLGSYPQIHQRQAFFQAVKYATSQIESGAQNNQDIFGNDIDANDDQQVSFVWQSSNGQVSLNDLPQPELVYLQLGDNQASLTFKFDIQATSTVYRSFIYVDATSGEIVGDANRIQSINTPASGTSLFQGDVSLTADSFGGEYRLREVTPNVITRDANNGESYALSTDYVSSDPIFDEPDNYTGVQAHFAAEQSLEYFQGVHNRASYNGLGADLLTYASFLENYVNAFWDGSRLTIGDGDGGINYNPLVTLDIIGHEFTHGVTEYTANLIYSYESGALNESFSDIFGESIENFGSGSNDWVSGAEVFVNGGYIRSLSNPDILGHPGTYQGNNWYFGSDDNGGVHINSGVQNKWFYLLSDGDSGTNDNGEAYNVLGIGIQDAARIAYRNLSVYLTPGSQYDDARAGSIQSAVDLFGFNSQQHLSTVAAWDAVGVYGLSLRLDPQLVESQGTLIYADSSTSETFFASDSQEAELKLDAGQVVSIRVAGQGSLIPNIELRDPNGNLLANVSSTSASEPAFVHSAPVASSGTYTILVQGTNSTFGAFDIDLLLNANFEMEVGIGSDNENLATAQNIDSSALAMGVVGDRLGVTGYLGQGYQIQAGDDFESGTFGPEWTMSSSHFDGRLVNWGGPGTVSGTQAMFMYGGVAATYNLNEAILSTDLSGVTGSQLSFWMGEWHEEEEYLPPSYTGSYNADGVSISEDGINWHTVLTEFDTEYGIFNYYEYDLDELANQFGITLGADFQVKFQQYDDDRIYNDGIGFDDVFIRVPEPNQDWYSFTVEAGQMISMAGNIVTGDNGLVVELYDSAGNLLQTGTTFGLQNGISNYENTGGTSTYYARVSGTTQKYSFVVTRGHDFDIEPNDIPESRGLNDLNGALGSVFKYRQISVDPDSFNNGTILDTRIEGLTFSNHVTGGSVWVATANIFVPPTGTNVFAPDFAAADGWREGENELRVDFDELQSWVSIDAGSDDISDRGRLQAYDVNDNLIAEITGSALAEGDSQTLSIRLTSEVIAYVVAFGVGTDITPMDNLQYTDFVVDEDAFSFDAVVGESIDFIGHLPGEGPFDFRNGLDTPDGNMLGLNLYDPNGNLVATGSDAVSWVATTAGEHMIVVYAQEGQGEYFLERMSAPAPGYRFDFGPSAQAVEVDFIGVSGDDYDAQTGFGWTQKVAFQDQDNSRGNSLTGDGFRAANARFAVDLDNGSYEVKVHIGFALHLDDVRVNVEGADYVFQPQANMIQSWKTDVVDGQLNLQFHGEFGDDSLIRVSGLEVLPISSKSGRSSAQVASDVKDGVTTDLNSLAEMQNEVFEKWSAGLAYHMKRDVSDLTKAFDVSILDISFQQHLPFEKVASMATPLAESSKLSDVEADLQKPSLIDANSTMDSKFVSDDCGNEPGCTCPNCIGLAMLTM